MGNCINNCSRGFYYNETIQQNTCLCELIQCNTCSFESLKNDLCTSCNIENDYYPIFNDKDNYYYPYFNCSKYPEGYYFDNETSVHKLCYLSCKLCNKSGNETFHNCIECKSNYTFEINFGIYKNCYSSDYLYFDKTDNISNSILNFQYPKEYDKLIEDKNRSISNCTGDEIYKYEFRNKCYENCPINSTERKNSSELTGLSLNYKYFCKPICDEDTPFEMVSTQECLKNCEIVYIIKKLCIINYKGKKENDYIKASDIMLENSEFIFTSNNYNLTYLEEGNNDIIEYGMMRIMLTTVPNQKKTMKSKNVIAVDLGKCEQILRDEYNISDDEILYMKIIDVKEEKMKIPKIIYDVHSKLNGTYLIKLNLSYCENTETDISIPIKLADNIDIYNPKSKYYNDLCYKTTSDFGTDIILKDRKNEFINNNRTLCQEKCIFMDYDYNIQKAKCTCKVSFKSLLSFEDIKINKSLLYENFVNIKNFANIGVILCYKVLFTKNGIAYNYGFYSIIILLILHFFFISLFYQKKFYEKINNKINDILFGIKNWYLVKSEKRERKKKERAKTNELNKIENNKKDIISNPIKKEKKIININDNNNCKNILNINKKSRKIKEQRILTSNIQSMNEFKKEEIIEKTKEIMSYNGEELNYLEYKLALKYDKRKYCQYYISLLKSKHILISTFYNNNDYNSKIIKLDLFIFSFALYYAINTLFFNDNTIHQIYEDKGSYNIIKKFPIIIYSLLISSLINTFFKKLALSQELILKFKSNKKEADLEKRKDILDKKLKIKFILYFIISSLFLVFFWYYISVFFAVYINTQLHLIKDTSISFILSLIYPLAIYLLPGIFRINALSDTKHNKKYLYNFGKIIQKI